MIRGAYDKFPDFFIQAFKIVVDSWKFSILLLYILWDDWPIFLISGSNELLQQELEYTLLKPDCHSWWISKMQSGTLEERYAIKFRNDSSSSSSSSSSSHLHIFSEFLSQDPESITHKLLSLTTSINN